MSFSYEYPRPAVTVDVILITQEKTPRVLLIQRKHDPFEGDWAFPGGFLDMDEDIETAALRELEEETNISNISIKQFKTYGAPKRDPRGRTVSIVFYAFIKEEIQTKAGDDASKAEWFNLNEIPKLAFDHDLIMKEFCNEIIQD
ncbi:NUDIX domain-containing protein [Labilibacter marinus]|uniref:NUDIX domain-containing protein n=1 Tax=Labilibacter marinus TaxID=1477105 RepID=UPI00082FA2C9|nr:NUDIX hydrolase [Labilibacter marinus]